MESRLWNVEAELCNVDWNRNGQLSGAILADNYTCKSLRPVFLLWIIQTVLSFLHATFAEECMC